MLKLYGTLSKVLGVVCALGVVFLVLFGRDALRVDLATIAGYAVISVMAALGCFALSEFIERFITLCEASEAQATRLYDLGERLRVIEKPKP